MAEKVHLTKAGIQALEWNGEAGQYVDKPISNALAVLRCDCYIDSGVTLGDIFRAVDRYPELVGFLRAWSWCNVQAFHAEACKPADSPSDLFHIEILRSFEWDEDGARQTIDVCGIGEPWGNGQTNYGIDFTPVNQLVHLPVRIRPRMEIRNDSGKVAEVPCKFTLLEVLGEIYWEISFFGSPADRDEKHAEIQESARDIQEGRAELAPLELPKKPVQ
jgi:hypothetical protein